MKILSRLLVILSSLSFVSCASYFVRQECKKIDWYNFGYEEAMKGNRLSNNVQIKKCEEADADIDHGAMDQGFKKGMKNYCLPDTAYITGKSGSFFQPSMCEGLNLKVLRERHKDGVREYCKKSNGYSAGAKGNVYNQICPKDLEEAFLPEFNKGRRNFLAESIRNKEREVIDMDREISTLDSRRSRLSFELSSLRGSQTTVRNKVWTGSGYREETQVVDDPAVTQRRNSLENDMRSVDSEIYSVRNRQNKLRKEISELNSELAKL